MDFSVNYMICVLPVVGAILSSHKLTCLLGKMHRSSWRFQFLFLGRVSDGAASETFEQSLSIVDFQLGHTSYKLTSAILGYVFMN